MNGALIDGIVKAVLYEGYMLYPYRPSAVKNRQRFNFGVVYPRSYSEAQGGSDAWTMQTQCLVLGNAETQCVVRVRFLRLVTRSVGKLTTPSCEADSVTERALEKVERLEVNGKTFHAWQEAVEEVIEVTEFNLSALEAQPMQWPFRLSAKQEREAVKDEGGLIVGAVLREKASVAGMIELAAERVKEGVFKLTTRISNISRFDGSCAVSRDEALARSLVSAHTILEARDGEFVSLVDPPEAYREFALACQNVGTWPVLVGEDGQRDVLLSSPIILYDYPQIAPESPGDLFDGAEIDEILSLRIMTMTEEEKREMRESDERARQILERTETLPEEQLLKLHGALRGLRRKGRNTLNEWEWQLLEDKTLVESIEIQGIQVRRGDRVRLRPRAGGDVFDLALAGKIAAVESIEQDYEGKLHVCVVVEDDPGRDIGLMRQPAHRFFFAPTEVEPTIQGKTTPAAETKNILIAGIGNIFLGDDGFGVEVASRLANHSFPSGVRVADFGIRGFDLAYALMEGYETTILVDAYPGEGQPGTLFVVEPDLKGLNSGGTQPGFVEPHAMNPINALRMTISMGGQLKRVLVVGCVPATLGPEEGQMGLSDPVAAAVNEAVKLIDSLVTRILAGEWPAKK